MKVGETTNACLGYRIEEGFVGFKLHSFQPKAKYFYSIPSEKPKVNVGGFAPATGGKEPSERTKQIIDILINAFFEKEKVYDLSSAEKRSAVADRLKAVLNVQV